MTIRVSTVITGILLCLGAVVFYFLHFRYFDIKKGCSIKVHPGLMEFNNKNVMQALSVLKDGAPEDYRDVCRHVKDIQLAMSCGGWQGGCYYPNQKVGEIYLSTTNSEFVAWTAAVIVHETCHDMQRREGRSLSEDECYARSDKTLSTLVQFE